MCAAHRLQRGGQRFTGRAEVEQQRTAIGPFHIRQREEKVLRADVVVAERLGIRIRPIEDLIQFARHLRLRIALLWIPGGLGLGALFQIRHLDASLLEQRHDDPVRLRDERQKKVQIVDQRIASTARQRHSVVHSFAGLDGKAIRIQHRANGLRVTRHDSCTGKSGCNRKARRDCRTRSPTAATMAEVAPCWQGLAP